jgi:hypothetical protein
MWVAGDSWHSSKVVQQQKLDEPIKKLGWSLFYFILAHVSLIAIVNY